MHLQDFLERFTLLTQPRVRLSTMAYFWNASSEAERLTHFRALLEVLAGKFHTLNHIEK